MNKPLAQYARKGFVSGPSGSRFPLFSPTEYQRFADGIREGKKTHYFSNNHLAVFCPVVTQGQRVGMVYLNADLQGFARWKRLFAGCMLAVLGVSFLLAYLLSRQLQHYISRPILYLVAKMEAVTKEEDFTVRAIKRSNDEVGVLIDGFNDMVAHLQDRDQQLDKYRIHLEDLVGKRTAQLSRANKTLQRTVAELERTKEAAEEANRIKSRFLANISHELRTPMVGVLSSTELLLNSGLDSGQRTLVETLNSSGEALLDILNDLLDLSKIEAGKLTLEHVDFNLLEVIDGPVELLGKGAFAKDVELVCDVSPELPQLLRGDPGRLRQVLFNLLSNAIKFTSSGEVLLRVIPEQQGLHKAVLRFEVIDTGVGIQAADQLRIFDSFSQADESITRLHGGTGLGLSIVKQLVEIMGGRVGLQSEPGKGSTFSFVLSFEVASNAVPAWQEGVGKSILVIEKNETTCRMLHRRLSHAGWTVQISKNCPAAVKHIQQAYAREEFFDVGLISDSFSMDDRLEVIGSLRSSQAAPITRIISMGPRQSQAGWDKATMTAISAHFYKPLLPSRLHVLLANVVSAAEKIAAAPIASSMSTKSTTLSQSTSASRHILLAEDNATTSQLIEISLSNIGYRVTVVRDGQAVLEKLASQPCDLVLMDCQMPVMDGYTAARAMREAGYRVPIIALTAFSSQENEDRCHAAGMNDYLCKPFKHKVLHQLIDKWLTNPIDLSLKAL
ncbi:MAG: ATP-binding protein [Syntrophotaleaceae bacterium]